jgi:GDP-L-fucose synthase
MFFNLARFSDRYEKMIVFGSGAIYDGRHYHHAMREEEWKEYIPADDHGFCKYVCETYIEKSSNIVDLRLFGIFGKYEDYAIRFISNMICKAMFDLPLTLKQNRLFDYLYIDDLMPALEWFLENNSRFTSYNLTPGQPVALTELAALVLDILGKKLPIAIAAPGMGLEYTADTSRLRAEVPGLDFTSMPSAVAALASWYDTIKDRLDSKLLMVDK